MHFEETPVPIPNTEVKLNVVDDTCTISAGKVGWCYHYCEWMFSDQQYAVI